MSTIIVKSTQISNADSGILSDPFLADGILRSAVGLCATSGSADAVGTEYKLVRVPSNARINKFEFQNSALGSGAAVNIGVYYPTSIQGGAGVAQSDAGTVISSTFFASAQSVASAAGMTEYAPSQANQQLPLWSALGLSSDPKCDLDIVAVVSTVFAASGTVSARVEYQQ